MSIAASAPGDAGAGRALTLQCQPASRDAGSDEGVAVSVVSVAASVEASVAPGAASVAASPSSGSGGRLAKSGTVAVQLATAV